MPKGQKGFQPGNQLGKLADHSNRKKKRVFEKAILDQLFEKDQTGLTVLERMVKKQIQNALAGDLGAFREIMERIDGKVAQEVQGQFVHHNFDLTKCSTEQLKNLEQVLETAMVIEGTAEEIPPAEPKKITRG